MKAIKNPADGEKLQAEYKGKTNDKNSLWLILMKEKWLNLQKFYEIQCTFQNWCLYGQNRWENADYC